MPNDTPKTENSGGSVSYYTVDINHPNSGEPYQAECLDIMESLEMTVHENNVFKAVWRMAAQRQGKLKEGNSSVRDAEKIAFFGNRILELEQLK